MFHTGWTLSCHIKKSKVCFFLFSIRYHSAYGSRIDLFSSNYWVLLLTEVSILGGHGTATFIWLLWPNGWGFTLSPSTPFLFVSGSLPWCEVLSWQTLSYAHEGSTVGTQASRACPYRCCGGSVPLQRNHFWRLNVWWNLHTYFVLRVVWFFLLRLPVRMSIWKGFVFLVLDGFFSCEVETYPLGIALGNSYFYTDCPRVVSS